MTTENRFIITGTFGSGKSTLLQHLRTLGYACIEEPARPILAEQRSIDGNGLPERDARLFVELMLSRAIHEYRRIVTPVTPVFFDRGIADILAYASLFGFDYLPGLNAARSYHYNPHVFFLPAWEQIYITDAERTVSFPVADEFSKDLQAIYEKCGYVLIDVPCLSVAERADFILAYI